MSHTRGGTVATPALTSFRSLPGVTRALLAALLVGACSGERQRVAADSGASVRPATPVAQPPAWLAPIFASLDTLLTPAQRDSLRALSLDDAQRYRGWHLVEQLRPVAAAWQRTPLGDTVIARGEQAFMTTDVALDLYHQQLRGAAPDLSAALHRISPAYIESRNYLPAERDSTLLEQDLDGDGLRDRLVRERRRRVGSTGADPVDAGRSRRLALYLGDASRSAEPAWALPWDDEHDATLHRTIPVGAGGSLLVVRASAADADESIVVLARRGAAREVLRHQIDYGEGSFTIRAAGDTIIVEASGAVQIDGRTLAPTGLCRAPLRRGAVLAFDAAAGRFRARQDNCIRPPNAARDRSG